MIYSIKPKKLEKEQQFRLTNAEYEISQAEWWPAQNKQRKPNRASSLKEAQHQLV